MLTQCRQFRTPTYLRNRIFVYRAPMRSDIGGDGLRRSHWSLVATGLRTTARRQTGALKLLQASDTAVEDFVWQPKFAAPVYFISRKEYKPCFVAGTDKRCRRADCIRYECRLEWLERVSRRLRRGRYQFPDDHRWWLLVVSPGDSHVRFTEEDELKKYTRSVGRLFTLIGEAAKREGERWSSARVVGLKSRLAGVPGQPHYHALVAYLPDCLPSPTVGTPSRHKSAWVQKRADRLGLAVWIEKVRDYDHWRKYMLQNLLDALSYELPPYFRKVQFSRTWSRT